MESNTDQNEALQGLLLESLNEQGYLFQEACKYELQNHETGWSFVASEYPVSLLGQDTKIDIVLHAKNVDSYAVLECKRADPSYSCWLFGYPNLELEISPECHILCLENCDTNDSLPTYPIYKINNISPDVTTYVGNNWLEAKLEAKMTDNKRISSPQNIENAFSQVLKGISGFAAEQYNQRYKERVRFEASFIPVVITTAKLYVAYYEPKDVSLSDGRIRKESVFFGPRGMQPEEQGWVLVHYGASESIAPFSIPDDFEEHDPRQLIRYKTRSIFIVNSKHIVPFFNNLCS